jgi:hypothetical protein
MAHTYEVTEAVYNATSRDPNPRILISATVDGIDTGRFHFTAYWDQIQQANSVGGPDAVRWVLQPILLSIYGAPYPAVPVFSAPANPAPFIANERVVSVSEALVGNWTA